MVRYDLQALIHRFDTRPTEAGEGAVVGALSSLLGESLLLDLLAGALRARRSTVQLLPGTPRRDSAAFKDYGLEVPSHRDLDAWLLIDETSVAAVECKHWTSSSNRFTSVGADVSSYAVQRWNLLQREDLQAAVWTSAGKIALPLRPPAGCDDLPAELRRILAIWTPTSRNGRSPFSATVTTTPVNGVYQSIPIEVFSGSLYARELLAKGRHHLDATISNVHSRLDALDALLPRVVDQPGDARQGPAKDH